MLNNVSIVGRLTRSPELQTTANGKTVCNFNIANGSSYKEQKAVFLDCTCWGNTANFMSQYGVKGSLVSVTGSIMDKSYTNKEGVKIYRLGINVREAEFVGSKSDNQENSQASGQGYVKNDNDFSIIDGDEDLPF